MLIKREALSLVFGPGGGQVFLSLQPVIAFPQTDDVPRRAVSLTSHNTTFASGPCVTVDTVTLLC